MFAPGPSRKCAPLAFASLPISVPTRSASAGFHVAAKAIPPAMAVAGPKLRTPTGPSAIFRRGNPSRGRARIKKSSTPPSMSIFSSSVIRLRIASTRSSTSPGAGQADCTKACIPMRRTIATPEQIFRMGRREASRHIDFVFLVILPPTQSYALFTVNHPFPASRRHRSWLVRAAPVPTFRRQGGPTFSSAHEKPGIGLLACVADTPNGIGAVIRHHQRTLLGDSDSNGSAPDLPLRRHETGEKVLVFPACAAVLQRHANYFVPCAHGPVPRAMLRGEDISPIFRRELLAVVKCHLEGGIMGFDENIGHDNLVF